VRCPREPAEPLLAADADPVAAAPGLHHRSRRTASGSGVLPDLMAPSTSTSAARPRQLHRIAPSTTAARELIQGGDQIHGIAPSTTATRELIQGGDQIHGGKIRDDEIRGSRIRGSRTRGNPRLRDPRQPHLRLRDPRQPTVARSEDIQQAVPGFHSTSQINKCKLNSVSLANGNSLCSGIYEALVLSGNRAVNIGRYRYNS
ncbi:hypothetical protein EJB05_33954, partial [Eragrostis curvula]